MPRSLIGRFLLLAFFLVAAGSALPSHGQAGSDSPLEETVERTADLIQDETGVNDRDHDTPGDGHAPEHGDGHGDAHGEHDKHGVIGSVAQGTVAGIAAIVVFLVVLAILGTQVWPKIAKALDDREKKILDEIESAEAARQQAKDALDQYEKSLAEARAESQQMLEQTKADQQKLAAELRAKSEAELGELKDKAQRDIEAARRAAVSEIYAEASVLATRVAEKILRREVNTGDQQRLVDEAVAELRGSGQG